MVDLGGRSINKKTKKKNKTIEEAHRVKRNNTTERIKTSRTK